MKNTFVQTTIYDLGFCVWILRVLFGYRVFGMAAPLIHCLPSVPPPSHQQYYMVYTLSAVLFGMVVGGVGRVALVLCVDRRDADGEGIRGIWARSGRKETCRLI